MNVAAAVTVAALNGKKSESGNEAPSGPSGSLNKANFKTSGEFTDDEGNKHEEEDPMAAFIRQMKEEEEEEARIEALKNFVDRNSFMYVIMFAICANAVQMGLELQFEDGMWIEIWFVFEHFWTALFLVEMIVKLFFMRQAYFHYKANLIDFVIVVFAVVDNWCLSFFMTKAEMDEVGFLSVIKLVRLLRIYKLMRMKRELALLLDGITSSFGAMSWLGVMLLILVYTSAILFIQFIGRTDIYPIDEFDNKKYFGNMVSACMTGLNLAMLEEFPQVVRPIVKRQPHFALLIGVYVGISSFGIMNALIGIIVTRTSAASEKAAAASYKEFQRQQMGFVANISSIIYAIDTDGDGTVSAQEIEDAKDNPDLMEVLEKVELPFAFTLTDLHCMLDKDGDGELTKTEFFVSMKRLIFSNDFQRQCLMLLTLAQQKRKMYEAKCELDDHFAALHSRLDGDVENLNQRLDQINEHVDMGPSGGGGSGVPGSAGKRVSFPEEDMAAVAEKAAAKVIADKAAADEIVAYEAAEKEAILKEESVQEKIIERMVQSTMVGTIMSVEEQLQNYLAPITLGLTRTVEEVHHIGNKLNYMVETALPAQEALTNMDVQQKQAQVDQLKFATEAVEQFMGQKAKETEQVESLREHIELLRESILTNVEALKVQMQSDVGTINNQMTNDNAFMMDRLEKLQNRPEQCSAINMPNPLPPGPYTLALTDASITIQTKRPPMVTAGPILLPPAQGMIACTDSMGNNMQASFSEQILLPGNGKPQPRLGSPGTSQQLGSQGGQYSNPMSPAGNMPQQQQQQQQQWNQQQGGAGNMQQQQQQQQWNNNQQRSNLPGVVNYQQGGSPQSAGQSGLRQAGAMPVQAGSMF